MHCGICDIIHIVEFVCRVRMMIIVTPYNMRYFSGYTWVYVGIRKNITSSFLSQTSNNLDTSIFKKITICYLLVVVLQKLIISQLLTFLLYLNTPLLIYWLGKQWRSREYSRPGPNIYGRGYWYSRNTFASVIATNSPLTPSLLRHCWKV